MHLKYVMNVACLFNDIKYFSISFECTIRNCVIKCRNLNCIYCKVAASTTTRNSLMWLKLHFWANRWEYEYSGR